MGFVEGETGSCSETGVECDDARTEEVSTKVEESIDIKDEIAEPMSLPPMKTEQEVRLWFGCEVVASHGFRLYIAQKGNCKITLNYFLLHVIFWVAI
jgi:hypothetical protein